MNIFKVPIACILITSCSLHNINIDQKPLVAVASKYSSTQETGEENWWKNFKRSELSKLISTSLDNNFDLKQSYYRVKQAESIITKTKSSLLPQIDGSYNFDDGTIDGNSRNSSSSAGVSLEWEVDLFNKIGSAIESDKFDKLALFENYQFLKLSISAEIASSYFGAVAANETIKLLNKQEKLDLELLDLLKLRRREGLGTNVEVLQQEARVAENNSLIPSAQTDLRVFENRLDILAGKASDSLDYVPKNENLDIAILKSDINIPINLLERRPDLRAAKAELLSADISIGEAMADRFPNLTLSGSYEYFDRGLQNSASSGPVGILMASFVQPILDWGKRKAEVERNKFLYQEKIAAFTQKFIEAVEDVENALYRENRQREFIKLLNKRITILNKTVHEAKSRYQEGLDNYISVINSLQELREVERDIIAEKLKLVQFRIDVYKAVGGNVNDEEIQSES